MKTFRPAQILDYKAYLVIMAILLAFSLIATKSLLIFTMAVPFLILIAGVKLIANGMFYNSHYGKTFSVNSSGFVLQDKENQERHSLSSIKEFTREYVSRYGNRVKIKTSKGEIKFFSPDAYKIEKELKFLLESKGRILTRKGTFFPYIGSVYKVK